ncbi:tetrahydromethanopterin S-methyltransferase subunit H [Candidatus Thorarchaeota archaeon]|nr:MAG: tetrahydromethanopterin S-methyltransferase subunit H [Candidatus Thorarchaeota archaeon]
MFVFEKEQVIHTIGRVKIGGNLGETPTVLAGTIFYSGHRIVENAKKGDFDKAAAESLLQKQTDMSTATGNPALVQIFSESADAMHRYIDFVSSVCDSPFLVDSTDVNVRLDGLRYAEEVGLLDCAIYNSINTSITKDEIDALKEVRPESAIVLAFNPQDPSIKGRRAVLETGVLELEQGLLDISRSVGISKPLIDTAATAMGAGAGSAVTFTFIAKTLYGQPTGCGIHNSPSSWPWLRKLKKKDRQAFVAADIASNAIVQTMGADYLLYGPIENAGLVFPVIAMADVLSAESAALEFGVEPSEDHPYHKLV